MGNQQRQLIRLSPKRKRMYQKVAKDWECPFVDTVLVSLEEKEIEIKIDQIGIVLYDFFKSLDSSKCEGVTTYDKGVNE